MKNIIYLNCAFLIACGSAPTDGLYGTSQVDFSVGGIFNSTGGGIFNSSGGQSTGGSNFSGRNGSGGSLAASGGVFNGNGGKSTLETGGAPTGGNAGAIGSGGATHNCNTCDGIGVELGGTKACGQVTNDCGITINCGIDCSNGKYDASYAACGASNGSWKNGSSFFSGANPNLCGLSCVSAEVATGQPTIYCSTSPGSGIPIDPNIPVEVICQSPTPNSPALPYPGCSRADNSIFHAAFCCPIN